MKNLLPSIFPQMRSKFRLCFFLCLLLSCVSCNDEMVSNKYCSLPARFTFYDTIKVPMLERACNNQGQWCSIEVKNTYYHFTSFDGTNANWPISAVEGYSHFYMGLTGFIVGLPDIPELGEIIPIVTCYDLACRNCYDEAYVARSVTLQEGGLAYCSRCHRTYDLNNTGQVSQGDAGKALYRYRVYYGNNTLAINNR